MTLFVARSGPEDGTSSDDAPDIGTGPDAAVSADAGAASDLGLTEDLGAQGPFEARKFDERWSEEESVLMFMGFGQESCALKLMPHLRRR